MRGSTNAAGFFVTAVLLLLSLVVIHLSKFTWYIVVLIVLLFYDINPFRTAVPFGR